jgi:hypothetical protein
MQPQPRINPDLGVIDTSLVSGLTQSFGLQIPLPGL